MKNIYLLLLITALFTACSLKDVKKDTGAKPKIQKQLPPTSEPVTEPSEPKPLVKPIVKVEKADFTGIIKTHPKDDEQFLLTLANSKKYYSRASVQAATFAYDDVNYTGSQMLSSLELFEQKLKESASYEEFMVSLSENFDLYESKNQKNSALITGYYAPVLKGSLEKTDKYTAPLYPIPKDLITVNLKKFSQNLPNRDLVGRLNKNELVPFYTRSEIDAGALNDTAPIAYLENKVDAFFLEIQGSGHILTDDGKKINIGYANKNGRAYTSIGSVISSEKRIASDNINMYTIREYLLSNPTEMDYILSKNESYVFFKIRENDGVFGNIGLPLTAKHSVAMDHALIPKGSLVYIKTTIPYKTSQDDQAIPRSQREPFEKFFFVQDTGGAIRGGGRVDIYFGEGDEAFFYAAQTASKGDVYLIVAKKDKLQQNNELPSDNIAITKVK